MVSAAIPQPGDIVRVRSRPWLVESVQLAEATGDSPVVHLSCLQDDALGEPLKVLWKHEIDAAIRPGR